MAKPEWLPFGDHTITRRKQSGNPPWAGAK